MKIQKSELPILSFKFNEVQSQMCKMCQQPRQDIDSWLGLPDFSYSIQLIDFSIITFTRELVPFVVLFAFSHPVQSPSISPWSMQTTGLPGVTALSQPSQATLFGIWLSLSGHCWLHQSSLTVFNQSSGRVVYS